MTSLVRVARVAARLVPFDWRWPEENHALVAAHWARRVAARPAMFDGRVLMSCALRVADGAAEAEFFATDYSRLIAFVDHGCPDPAVANAFAMGALVGADGGFLLGRMAPHTANAGRLYFPCGTPDMADVGPDGTVDLAGSLTREIAEETGLDPADAAIEPGWTIVRTGGFLAFMRQVRLPMPAEAARARIRAHLAAEERPELDDIEIVRDLSGLDPDPSRMPSVVPIYLRDAFATARQPG